MKEIPEMDSEFERTERFGQSDFRYGYNGSGLSGPNAQMPKVVEEEIDEEEKAAREE